MPPLTQHNQLLDMGIEAKFLVIMEGVQHLTVFNLVSMNQNDQNSTPSGGEFCVCGGPDKPRKLRSPSKLHTGLLKL